MVYEPTAVHALETNRLMVRPRADQVSYYKGIAWSDRLPRLVQARMIETFQNSGAVKAVSSSTGQYALVTDLRAFQIDVTSGKAYAEIEIFAKLVNTSSGKVMATKGFSARVPADDRFAGRCHRRPEPGLHRGAARHHDLGRLAPRLASLYDLDDLPMSVGTARLEAGRDLPRPSAPHLKRRTPASLGGGGGEA